MHFASGMERVNARTNLDPTTSRFLHQTILFYHFSELQHIIQSVRVCVYIGYENIVTWIVLISLENVLSNKLTKLNLINMGEFPKALELYHLMLREGLVPDNFTFPLVLKAFSGLNDLEQGRIVRDQNGVQRDSL